jgi:hypothetical protein
MGEPVDIVLEFATAETLGRCDISIHVESAWGQTVLRFATREMASPFSNLCGNGSIRCRVPRLQLLAGRYSILIAASTPPAYEYLDYVTGAATFEVLADDVYGTGKTPEFGVFFAECEWERTA